MTDFKTFTTREADQARLARKATHVVWVERPDGGVEEQDCEGLAHAKARALNAVDLEGALTASFRSVRAKDGVTKCLGVMSPATAWKEDEACHAKS